jgi:DNA-binding GntR family transcriptional regulator
METATQVRKNRPMSQAPFKSSKRAPPRKAMPAQERGDQEVYDAIYEAVIDHRLPPATKLTEAAFAEIFGVSRTIVRQALIRLAHDNIVELRPNRGAVVASPSVAETRDVFEARRVIESALIPSVIRAANKEDFNRLRALVKEEQCALERRDPRSYIRLSGDFHVRLAEIAGNAVLADFLTELVSRTSLIIAVYEMAGNSACAPDTHLELIEEIARGDEKRAVSEMIQHLNEIEGRLHLVDRVKPIDLGEVFASRVNKPAHRRKR